MAKKSFPNKRISRKRKRILKKWDSSHGYYDQKDYSKSATTELLKEWNSIQFDRKEAHWAYNVKMKNKRL